MPCRRLGRARLTRRRSLSWPRGEGLVRAPCSTGISSGSSSGGSTADRSASSCGRGAVHGGRGVGGANSYHGPHGLPVAQRPLDGRPGPRFAVTEPRDRDATGRPRQGRPRDALGRPLPYGATGVEPVSEAALSPLESLATARTLLEAGRPFAAHEVLEARWKAGPEVERDLWQGLAQICVGLTHAARGNSVGALRLLDRGATRLEAYHAGHGPTHGLDLATIVAYAREHPDNRSLTTEFPSRFSSLLRARTGDSAAESPGQRPT
jgi:uncharacterized protein